MAYLIKKIEYNELLEAFISGLIESCSLYEIYFSKKITEEEMVAYIHESFNNLMKEKNTEGKIIKTVKFEDLISNKNSENNRPTLRNNPLYKYLLDAFLDSSIFFKDDREYINNNIWYFIDFFYNIYKDYFEYFTNRKKDFATEVEIIEKIVNFKKDHDFCKDLTYEEIYIKLISLFDRYVPEMTKIDNKIYLINILNENQYEKRQILDIKKYEALEIIYNSLRLIFLINKDKKRTIKYTNHVNLRFFYWRENTLSIKPEIININF